MPDSYTKDKKVGEGTYATVYLGTQVGTNRIVAIKKIKVTQEFKDGLDLSAIREVKVLQELKHENIIELIDVFSTKNNLHLVLEFLDADLEMIIKNTKGSWDSVINNISTVTLQAEHIKSWMLMILRGVRHCHRNFFLHRDLKPNNLLLASNGQLKLADFGLAKDYGDPARVQTSNVVTRWYRSPELLFGAQHYGGGIDIWAVGCIFAELMLRTPYLAGESEINQLQTIFRALGTPTEDIWPGMTSLPDYHEFQMFPRTPFKSLFTAAQDDALDLLTKMLTYDPYKRASAEDCLRHFYFRNKPRPCAPAKLPRDVGGQTHQYNMLLKQKEMQDQGKRVKLEPVDDKEDSTEPNTSKGISIAGMKRKTSEPASSVDGRRVSRKLF